VEDYDDGHEYESDGEGGRQGRQDIVDQFGGTHK